MRKALALFGLFLVTGCSANVNEVDESVLGDADEAAASLKSTSTYYSIRVDTRRCISPLCGGFWVKRLNQAYTTCVDGSSTTGECYVASVDWKAAGFDSQAGDIVRGKITKKDFGTFGKMGVFVPSEVWTAQTSGTASGAYYRTEDKGIYCIKAPCFTLSADKLNTTNTRTASALTGTYAKSATDAIADATLIIAGEVKNLANGGRGLSVTQYWTRASAKPADPTSCQSDADCATSPYGIEVKSAADCYCPMCPTNVMNAATEAYNRGSWEKFCSNVKMMCPLAMCIQPPDVGCVSNKCQYVASNTK